MKWLTKIADVLALLVKLAERIKPAKLGTPPIMERPGDRHDSPFGTPPPANPTGEVKP